MPRKADPSRRSTRRRSATEHAIATLPERKLPPETKADQDSDFGLCMALVPALRRRTDA